MSKKRNRNTVPFAALTHVGNVRALNEDSLLALPPLYAVADGLGGHESGEVASSLAIDALRDHAPKHPEPVALARAVQSANQAVISGISKGVGREGMGTTMTAVMIESGRAVFAQVGDSRAYLLRNRSLSQVTEDHSVVGEMMRSGHLTAEEARRHPQRSVITRALGSDPQLNVDTFEVTILRGDRLLICTDGLTTMVEDEKIQDILTGSLDPNHAAEKLVQAALDAGGNDNISVIVVDINEAQGANAAAMAAMKQKKPRSKLWLWMLIWTALVAAALAGVYFLTMDYVENRAYLSSQSGTVYLNKGVPGSILGFELTLDSFPTLVETDLLAPEFQARIELKPGFESVDYAMAELETMVERSPLYFDRAEEFITYGLLEENNP
ncbi:MAG: Stp1/IreP family PP2C-type Ser/Thr phosphatase [Coriobacteriia bacterium]|nr:Stp1/IreP family PP2C-type Ser/Thr phosphatase [Coriobacteriia bacterium]MCL2746488.1 Stp1/IreP family PP2C-type Ser/Thr phosphatase [Coriobacteriia bacterium]MCL2870796.1 Stp1/IreP family PP2C-type Ser/Thr phosphatase [Coriobacteriia bacterium]